MGGKSNQIVVVVPVYNEGKRAVLTIEEILSVLKKEKVVVVDDGSDKKSYSFLEKGFKNNKRTVLLKHMINLGKGAAMKTGAEWAFGNGAKGVIFIDSDGQHSPKYLPGFKRLLKKSGVVFGYRQLNGKMPFVRKWGNKIALNLVGKLFGIKRRDLLCGFMAMRKDIYKKLWWESNRYGVETEIATRVAKNKISFSELKIDTIYIDKYKGVTVIDALKILLNIPLWYLQK